MSDKSTPQQPTREQHTRPPLTHYVKSWPAVFREVKAGNKTAEFRLNDRDYRVGDTIVHQEYDPERQEYSGDEVSTPVTNAVYGPAFGIPDGYVMMSTPSQAALDALTVLGHPGAVEVCDPRTLPGVKPFALVELDCGQRRFRGDSRAAAIHQAAAAIRAQSALTTGEGKSNGN